MNKDKTGKPVYVICLDDEEGSLDFMVSAAHALGLTPLPYRDVDTAIRGLEEHFQSVALIIVDFKIGDDHTGIEVRKATKDFWAIPFVVMSGFVTREMALAGLESKIDAFFEKPAELKSLSEQLRKLIEQRLMDIEERRIIEATFFAEARDILQDLETQLLELENTEDRKRSLDHVFRLVHTLKGSSASALTSLNIKNFAHSYEDLLGKLKSNPASLQPKHIDVLIKGKDIIQQMIEGAENSEDIQAPADFTFDVDARPSQPSQIHTQAKAPKKAQDGHASKSIRVSAEALDEIEYLTAETTIQRNMISKLLSTIQKENPLSNSIYVLSEHFNEMSKLQSSIQTKVGMVHTVSFAEIVRPLSRVVRDLERQLSKSVTISFSGESLRVDHMTEKALSDCMVHLVRNCMDHGIEDPATRQGQGKNPRGTIQVKASEDVERYFIRIVDDGRGIDRERVKQKALNNGLYSQVELDAMSDDKVLNLIFSPGFSTAEKVTDVSGRGVGTDMVKTTIEGLGGRILLQSKVGEGTEMTLQIPKKNLSVSMVSVLVRIGSDTFAVPQASIFRLINLDSSRNCRVLKSEGSFVLQVDEKCVPLISLAALVKPDALSPGSELLAHCRDVIICSTARGKLALAVDVILDSEEVVVRPLKEFVNRQQYFKGAALFDDGRVGLVLDPETLGRVVYAQKVLASEQDEQKTALATQQEFVSYLLLESLDGQHCAVRQTEIYRIEEIPLQELRISLKKPVLIYRDIITPVEALFVGAAAQVQSEHQVDELGIFLITQPSQSRFMAHRVKQVIDIFEAVRDDRLENPLNPAQEEGGFLRRESQLFQIIVLNPAPEINLEAAKEKVPALPLEKAADLAAPPAQEAGAVGAAGWGLFE